MAGCSGAKNPLQRTLPDETQVIAGPSLSLPPSFELRPPRTGDANEALLRAPTAGGESSNSWVVNRAQQEAGTRADANIRTDLEAKVVEDKATEAEENQKKGLLQRWFGRK